MGAFSWADSRCGKRRQSGLQEGQAERGSVGADPRGAPPPPTAFRVPGTHPHKRGQLGGHRQGLGPRDGVRDDQAGLGGRQGARQDGAVAARQLLQQLHRAVWDLVGVGAGLLPQRQLLRQQLFALKRKRAGQGDTGSRVPGDSQGLRSPPMQSRPLAREAPHQHPTPGGAPGWAAPAPLPQGPRVPAPIEGGLVGCRSRDRDRQG